MRSSVTALLAAAASAALLLGCASSERVRVESARLIPEQLVTLGPELQESSGLARYAGRLWSMNDSEGEPELIWLELSSGRSGTLALQGAVNFDWEALAQSDDQLYLLDCGNNRGDRIWLQLYSVPLDQLTRAQAEVQRSDFRWGDVDYQVARRAHNNDCEAASWIGNELWLFTKNWQDEQSRIYRMQPGVDRQQLTSEQSINVGGLITGADYNAELQMLALLGYGKGLRVLQPFIWLAPLVDGELQWSLAKRFDLTESGQWEAVVWQDDELLLSREESILGGAAIAKLRLPRSALRHK
ncbi:MAG: hypothetical protein HWE12_02640 [Oceanospirillaceae bacterium]|nr:hypothetical protein [Oceanospirillaceae bacterium]